MWRIADGDADELQSLATTDSSDDETQKTAANWIKGFGAAAKGKVSADFYDEGSQRQVVVLYFHATHQVKEISARIDSDEDGNWRILMKETSFKDATGKPVWAPKEPGGAGSRH
ncbi:hypothetical protein [Streptomyces sp. NPDC053427]|uniref:hypothetical protein n=1 Tax=Streptomyces sp. NPDC053427 TaxID=3365701 RepID=UPI0037CF1FC4